MLPVLPAYCGRLGHISTHILQRTLPLGKAGAAVVLLVLMVNEPISALPAKSTATYGWHLRFVTIATAVMPHVVAQRWQGRPARMGSIDEATQTSNMHPYGQLKEALLQGRRKGSRSQALGERLGKESDSGCMGTTGI